MTISTIEHISIAALKLNPRNARTHSKKQIKQISQSIRKFGFTNPLLIDDENMVLAGHGRLAAAHLLGMEMIPCLRLGALSAAQKRSYVLADNKLALNAGWDEELLALELEELAGLELDFDIQLTGFTIAEVDSLIDGRIPKESGDPRDELLADAASGPAITQLGDVWQLGAHRLICGDSLLPETCKTLLAGEHAQMAFTDPPYNVPIAGHVSGLGAVKHREFSMAAGEMSAEEFTTFLRNAFQNLADYSVEGSIHFICMDWRHISEILGAGRTVFSELKNLIIWVKDNGGMGTFYRSRHELIFAFKKGVAPHINSFELGQHGRYRTNVWEYAGVNSLKAGRMDELAMHPTVKPVAMIADAIKDVSKRNDIVLDLFGGSGSTLIAAHKTGRRAYIVELDPVYCDRIIRRFELYANEDVHLKGCGQTFAQISAERSQMRKIDTSINRGNTILITPQPSDSNPVLNDQSSTEFLPVVGGQ
ncbi:MAG: DNA methyltransferase [Aestuariivirga sp.]